MIDKSPQDVYDEEYYKVRAYDEYTLGLHFTLLAYCINGYLSPMSALDVGCARGYMVQALRREGILAWGVDVSVYAVNSCPEEVEEYISQADVEGRFGVPFSGRAFDLVTCFECLEHLNEPEKGIKEMARVLLPQGYVLASSPKVTLWRRLYNLIIGRAEVHPSELSRDKWIELFGKHGLEYQGDFIKLWGIGTIMRSLTVQRTYKMIPCTRVGRALNRLGRVGKWLRVWLNVIAWQPEYMIFRKNECIDQDI